MKAKIVKIGNSQGIRIPKILLKQTGLNGEIDIQVDGNRLILAPATRPREGWEEAFDEIARKREDGLLDGYVPTRWDEEEWKW